MIINTKQKPKISNRLRYCRMTQRLKQKELAFLLDLEPTQISKWEQGERLPGIYNAVGLAVATDRLVEDVFFDFRKEWQEKIRDKRKLLGTAGKELMKTYSQRKAEMA
jgi:transcriptional regulator with XRE-family HTH domain